jgi:acetamidase/formamidase
VRIRVVLHKQVGWTWPMAETATHWFVLGIDADLHEAFRIAVRNAVDFLAKRTGMSRLDAYSLASIAVSFRVTQFVDQTRGIHAMIPTGIFNADLQRRITIA